MTEELSEFRAEVRAEARLTVLRARREVYEAFRREAHLAADQFRHDPSYTSLVGSLDERARERLGAAAEVEVDETVGGIVGRANGRRVDFRIPVIVDRCIDAMGNRVGELWQ